MRQVPELVEPSRLDAAEKLAWLDSDLGTREFIAGERFTIADITLFIVLDFFPKVGEPFDTGLSNIARWLEATAARPSASA